MKHLKLFEKFQEYWEEEDSIDKYINKKDMENVFKNTDGSSDSWFNEVEKLKKKFYCPKCDKKFSMYDVEKNGKGNKVWCLDCDELLFNIK